MRLLFGLAPGGACRATAVTSRAVGFTPPFHHYLACKAVSSLWRFPWGYPRRALPGTVVSGSPDFPRRLHPRDCPAPRAGLVLGGHSLLVKALRLRESFGPDPIESECLDYPADQMLLDEIFGGKLLEL